MCGIVFSEQYRLFFVAVVLRRDAQILTTYNHLFAQMFICLINKVKFIINIFISLITRVQ